MATPSPLNRRQFSALSAGLTAAVLAPSLRAQGVWPSRPVRMVLGYSPGGGADVMARVLAPLLNDSLGQVFIVDNKPGASGNIATVEVARSSADGYTLMFSMSAQISANPYIFKMPLDPAKDLIPVAVVGRYPLNLVTRMGLPFKTFKEFLNYGRANPNKLSYASAGVGTPPHLVAEAMLRQAGIRAVHVPYKGSAPALQAMLTGEADIVIVEGIAFPYVRAGKVMLLATAGNTRIPEFADVPTMQEAGLQHMDFSVWLGVFAPAGTPAAVTARLSEALSKALTNPPAALTKSFTSVGAEVIYLNAPEFQSLIQRETQAYSGLIKELNIKVE